MSLYTALFLHPHNADFRTGTQAWSTRAKEGTLSCINTCKPGRGRLWSCAGILVHRWPSTRHQQSSTCYIHRSGQQEAANNTKRGIAPSTPSFMRAMVVCPDWPSVRCCCVPRSLTGQTHGQAYNCPSRATRPYTCKQIVGIANTMLCEPRCVALALSPK